MVLAYLPQDSRCDNIVIVACWKATDNVDVACPADGWVVGWILSAGSNSVDEVVDFLDGEAPAFIVIETKQGIGERVIVNLVFRQANPMPCSVTTRRRSILKPQIF